MTPPVALNPECRLLAEGVEKVGAVRLFATIVPLSGACGNIDSTLPPALNHCFKNSDPGDFFTTLGYKPSIELLLLYDCFGIG
jgi:hypothetical protein